MVDINLFDDEAEEPKKDENQEESWDALPDEGEGPEESDLDDDLLLVTILRNPLLWMREHC